MRIWHVTALLFLAALATALVQLVHLSHSGILSTPSRAHTKVAASLQPALSQHASAERPSPAATGKTVPEREGVPATAPPPPGAPTLGVPRITKIGYVKTHKTASTTLGAVLFRFGARNGERFYCQGKTAQPCRAAHIVWANRTLPPGEEGAFDLQLNHFSGNGLWKGDFKRHVVDWYQRMLGGRTGDQGPNWALVGMVREPVSRYLSWFFYFSEPDSHLSVEQYARRGQGANGLAKEFGLKTEADAKEFSRELAWGLRDPSGGEFAALQLWLPMERFEEALLLLGRTLGWSLLDLTYLKMFDSHRVNATRWDGKQIKPTPKAKDLPESVLQRIRSLTALDSLLYESALAAFEGALGRARGTPELRAAWDADAAELARMQGALLETLAEKTPCAAALKHWYSLDDLGYEGKVEPDGFVRMHPALSYGAMERAYARSGKTRFC